MKVVRLCRKLCDQCNVGGKGMKDNCRHRRWCKKRVGRDRGSERGVEIILATRIGNYFFCNVHDLVTMQCVLDGRSHFVCCNDA